MSFFRRSCKTDITSRADLRAQASSATHDQLQHALHSLQSTLQQFQRPEPPATPARPLDWGGVALCAVGLAALTGAALYATRTPRIPAGIAPTENFDIERYLGTWYEVARIERRFDKGLQRTQFAYSRSPRGGLHVIRRGYDPKHGAWRIRHGQARPTLAPDVAALKVSFFGPFYDGYNVVALDAHYRWAMVVGDSLHDFWILSRTPALPPGIAERLMHLALQLGIPTQHVQWVLQDGVNPTGS